MFDGANRSRVGSGLIKKQVSPGPAVVSAPSVIVPQSEDKSSVASPQKYEKETQKVATGNITEGRISEITSLALARPLSLSKDLSCLTIDGEAIRFDILSTDSDLARLVEKKYIKYLNVSDCFNITDFSLIGELSNLEQLDLTDCKITDFSFLKKLTKLKVLNLSNTNVENLDFLREMPFLEILNLRLTKIKTLEGIENCHNLHDLILFGCSNFNNLNPLTNCKELRFLDLVSCTLLKDLTPIANATKMLFLNLNYTTIENLSVIENFVNLELFTMDYCPLIIGDKNLSYFNNLLKLKSLCLRNRGIKDIEFLKNLSNLRDLDLSGNLIHNLEPIANATEMRSLNLSNNIGITTLDPLHKMTKLEKLNVAGLQTTPMLLADIDIVKMFSNLLSINCNYNKNIKDISPLIFCQKLEEVFFDNCLRIGDITPLRHCLFLKKISFENNVLIKHYEFLRELNNISFINLSKTSINQTYIANFMSMPNSPTFKVDENPSAIIKIIFESIRVNAKLFDIIKKWF